MTQKEYKEKIKEYENTTAELRLEIEKAEEVRDIGTEALKQYYGLAKELDIERRNNKHLQFEMQAQKK